MAGGDRPDRRTGGEVNREEVDRAVEPEESWRQPAPHPRSITFRRKVLAEARHARSATIESSRMPPRPSLGPIVEKVRKFADIAEALRRGQHFEITRLTSLKGLCKDPGAARSFALFLAVHARKKAEEKKAPSGSRN